MVTYRLHVALLAALASLGLSSLACAAQPTYDDGALPWLRVQGALIVDPQGQPFRLSDHGIPPINPGEWNGRTAQQIAAEYKAKGCTGMRVAFYRNNDYDQARDQIKELGYDRFIDAWIEPQVRAVIQEGVYAIIDWHGYQSDLPFLYAELIPLWERIAARYKDEPGVAIYELWNEPQCGGEAGAEGLRAWYREAIRAIRAIDPRHIIMVSD
jgi:aryl-phospho-beta-D-glucosidase BglC (GH1 family)